MKLIFTLDTKYWYESFPKVADFFNSNDNTMLTLADFNLKYNIDFDHEKYIDIRYTLATAMQSLGVRLDDIIVQSEPTQPLLVNIAMQATKGCSSFYKVLTKKSILNNKIHLREEIWHQKLNSVYSLDFWKKTWKLVTDLKHENRLRWFQYQIVRHCLQTNHVVNKQKPYVSPLCSYCGTGTGEREKIEHLFWSCAHVHNFWVELTDFFFDHSIFIPLEKRKIIFGINNEPPDSINNYIIPRRFTL